MESLDPARRGPGGDDEAVDLGPETSHLLLGHGPGPGYPRGDAQSLSQGLQLFLGRSGADHDQRPAPQQLHAGTEQRVESLLGTQPPYKAESESAAFLALRFDRRRQSGLGNDG